MLSTKSYLFVALLCSAIFVTYVASDTNLPIFQGCLSDLGIERNGSQPLSEDLRGKLATCVTKNGGTVAPNGMFAPDIEADYFPKDMNGQMQMNNATG